MIIMTTNNKFLIKNVLIKPLYVQLNGHLTTRFGVETYKRKHNLVLIVLDQKNLDVQNDLAVDKQKRSHTRYF